MASLSAPQRDPVADVFRDYGASLLLWSRTLDGHGQTYEDWYAEQDRLTDEHGDEGRDDG